MTPLFTRTTLEHRGHSSILASMKKMRRIEYIIYINLTIP